MSENANNKIEKSGKNTRKTPIKRVFADNIQIFHDLFRLNTAEMKRNKSWNDTPMWVSIKHEHFFHTVDSSGRPQKYCAPVGGHFHELKVTKNNKGEIVDVEVIGGPLKFLRKKVNGRIKKVAVPFNEQDQHTHEISYEGSNKLGKAKINNEAVRHMSQIIAKQTSKKVEGGDDLKVTSDDL